MMIFVSFKERARVFFVRGKVGRQVNTKKKGLRHDKIQESSWFLVVFQKSRIRTHIIITRQKATCQSTSPDP